MNLNSLLADIEPAALDEMASSLSERSVMLAKEADPAASAWQRLYGYLSVEMDCAALRQRTGISL
jgi:hypothetical protein